MAEQKLFGQFPPVSTQKWEEVIAADLKGADYDKKLVWRSREGFSVRPYYRAEDLAGLKYLGAEIGEFPYVRSTGRCNRWLISQTVDRCEQALAAVKGGAEAVTIHVDKDTDVEALLKGLEDVEVTLCGGGADLAKKAAGVKREKALNFCIDPVTSGKCACGDGLGHCYETIASLVKAAEGSGKMRFVTVRGHEAGNAGATIVEELAFMLAAGHDYLVGLTGAGLTIDQAACTLRFKASISANYFMEIAKLRAARMLWATIVRQYKPEKACAEKMRIHAESSRWNMTVYDAYVNMLRGTTEAMSAAIGGVHSLEVLPFNAAYEDATEFSSRIARNVQLLLKHESHFDNVVDPSGGSYYIENLTQSIAEQAWALFKEVEAKGGYSAAREFIAERIAASATAKAKDVATRKIVLLGTNQYPNFNEVVKVDVPASVRGAEPFERMRLAVDKSGRNPKVFLLTCGTLGMARARAQFATNFFGCAGFRIEDNTFFASVKEGVDTALKSKAEVVVLCGADDDYPTLAPEVYDALKGKAIVVVAGANQPELETRGITNFINVKSNVLETLQKYVKELGL